MIVPDVHRRQGPARGFKSSGALNTDVMPRLRVHDIYASALKQHKGGKERSQALQQRLQEARWFIKNIQQRFDTILRVSNAIVERQKNFFTHGELAMRPLVLREIADELGLHESTISRVTTAKYMATPFGTFELKYFFGSGLGTETGGNASSTAVRALIKQFVASESPKKPLSDNQISDMLKEQGIECARRTVAKYREALRIAPANLAQGAVKNIMNQLQLFLPCAAGVEDLLAAEVQRITGIDGQGLARGGVQLQGSWRDAMQLNLHSRLAQRVLMRAARTASTAASRTCTTPPASVAWEIWFTPDADLQGRDHRAAQPAAKPELCRAEDQGRDCRPLSPQVQRRAPQTSTPSWPDVRIYAHLTTDTVHALHRHLGRAAVQARLARGQGRRAAEGNAGRRHDCRQRLGPAVQARACRCTTRAAASGTIAIEAAQIACNIAPGINRRLPSRSICRSRRHVWDGLLRPGRSGRSPSRQRRCFGSDVSFRMVDFAERNAERAGVADAVQVARRRRAAAHAARAEPA